MVDRWTPRHLAIVCAAAFCPWLAGQGPEPSSPSRTSSPPRIPASKSFSLRADKTRFRGLESIPVSGTHVLIRKFSMDTFAGDGSPEISVEAPECLFNLADKSASSQGSIKVVRADGSMSIEGVGFSWNQSAAHLVISNQVRAVLRKSAVQSQPARHPSP